MSGQKRGDLGRLVDLMPRVRDIPGDLLKSQKAVLDVFRYRDYNAMFTSSDEPMSVYDLLKVITKIEQNRFDLETIGNAFTPQVIAVGTTPTRVLPPNKTPRGYLFLNPTQTVNGVTTDTNMFTPAVRGAGTYTSAAINVQAFRTSRFFLNITASPATLKVDVQTQDPQSGNWAVAQSDIFAGAVAINTFYADAGEIGTDDFLRLVVTQTGAGANWSITMTSKEAYGATLAPPAIFLGNQNVTVGLGYPLPGGQERRFFLMDNTPMFAIAKAAANLNLFQLQ